RRLTTTVNGEIRQDDSTASMKLSVDELVESITRSMTLVPGDVIATGTPAGVGYSQDPPRWLRHDDVVEVAIEGIGVLRNRVTDELAGSHPRSAAGTTTESGVVPAAERSGGRG